MNSILALIHEYPVQCLAAWTLMVTAAHHAFDAAVDALDPPTAGDSRKYRFIYNFTQKLAGNYRKSS